MKLDNKSIDKAEYDRFINLMAQMYLKYGDKYRVLNMEEVIKLFPKHQCGKNHKF